MNQNDFSDFHALLEDCMAMWGGQPSAKVAAMWFGCLSAHSVDEVRSAFIDHMRDPANGKFEPKPAHIIEQLERAAKKDGRPGVEEAWAMSLSAKNERDTVIWTSECSQAWFVAKPVLDAGDEVGARLAFKEAYARLVAEARARKEPTDWQLSIGFDKEKRRSAINEAVEAGRIPPARHIEYQPSDILMIETSVNMPAEIAEKLKELRKSLASSQFNKSESERERTSALKKAQQEKADAYLQKDKSDD
jgi:hypothetical protein